MTGGRHAGAGRTTGHTQTDTWVLGIRVLDIGRAKYQKYQMVHDSA
jgi:hypothetical protein